MKKSQIAIQKPKKGIRFKYFAFPLLIATIGIILTTALTVYWWRQGKTKDELHFNELKDEVVENLEATVLTRIALLQATTGTFAIGDRPTAEEFHRSIMQLKIRENYPGTQGIGFTVTIPYSEYPSLETSMRRQGFAKFSVHPTPKLEEEVHSIIYLEPQDTRNLAALGFNMYSEPTRNEAMSRARDTGETILSGKVTLVQEIDEHKQAGFLIYTPVYRNAIVPESVESRRASLIGFVYSPFRADDFLKTTYSEDVSKEIAIQMYDGDPKETNLIHSSSNPDKKPSYQDTVSLHLAGRTWTIQFSSAPGFVFSPEHKYVINITVIGFVLSLLIAYLMYLQLTTQQQKIDILEAITDGFFSVDRNWALTHVNNEAAKSFSMSQTELLGKNLWVIFPELANSDFGKLYKKSMKTHNFGAHEGYYEPLKGWFSVRVYPGESGLSVYFQNISDRIEIDRQKDEFIAIASHELKTPITSIKSYAQILQKRMKQSDDVDSKRLTDRMDQQINKLTVLIEDLLDVSKIEGGKLEFNYTKFEINKLIQETVDDLKAASKNHQIILNLDHDVVIKADRDRISQVITNFITNAVKYSPESEKILINSKVSKSSITVSVTDFGIGIPRGKNKDVFKKFVRIEHKRTRFPGLGLGLFISAEIIERHKGKIWVESKEGKGSTFFFEIPVTLNRP